MNLKQKAVLWERTGIDKYGEPVVGDPEEIDCRWEERFAESISPQGTPIAINGAVDVDREIPTGSILWLGELNELPGTPTDGLMEVINLDRTPDIKGRPPADGDGAQVAGYPAGRDQLNGGNLLLGLVVAGAVMYGASVLLWQRGPDD